VNFAGLSIASSKMHARGSGAQRPDHAHSSFGPSSSGFVHNSTQTLVGPESFCKSPLRYPSFPPVAPAGSLGPVGSQGPSSGAASMEFEPWINWTPQSTQHVHHVRPRGTGPPSGPRGASYLPVELDSAAFHLKVHHPGVHLVQPPGDAAPSGSGGPPGPPTRGPAEGDREDSPMMGVCVQQSPVVSH